jgi:hypothetical protein
MDKSLLVAERLTDPTRKTAADKKRRGGGESVTISFVFHVFDQQIVVFQPT